MMDIIRYKGLYFGLFFSTSTAASTYSVLVVSWYSQHLGPLNLFTGMFGQEIFTFAPSISHPPGIRAGEFSPTACLITIP